MLRYHSQSSPDIQHDHQAEEIRAKKKKQLKFFEPTFNLDKDKSLMEIVQIVEHQQESVKCKVCCVPFKRKKSAKKKLNCVLCGDKCCKNCAFQCRFPECFGFQDKKNVCGTCYPGYLLLRPYPNRTFEEHHQKLENYMRKHIFEQDIDLNEQEKKESANKLNHSGFFRTESEIPALTLKTKIADKVAIGLLYYSGMREGGELDRSLINRISKRKVKVETIHSVTDEYIPVPYRYTPDESYEFDRYKINPAEVLEPIKENEPEFFDLKVKIYHCNEMSQDNLQPVILWMHGGGFVLGDVDDSVAHRMSIRLSKYIQGIVININYRLAPEFKWPTQPEDCYSVLKWVYEHGKEKLGADVDRIAVGGDSAGGNLATVICIMAKLRRGPKILHQMCIYPGVHADDTESESFRRFKKGPLLRLSLLLWFKAQYLYNPETNICDHPFVSPLLYDDILGLPPLTMITAGYCPLTDHARLYAEKLKKAGIPVSYTEYTNCFHGFFNTFSDESISAVMEGCIIFNIQFALASKLSSMIEEESLSETEISE